MVKPIYIQRSRSKKKRKAVAVTVTSSPCDMDLRRGDPMGDLLSAFAFGFCAGLLSAMAAVILVRILARRF